MILLVAACVLADPYGGFHARLHPFGMTSIRPITEKLLRGQYDVTSLLYKDRERFRALLRSADEPAEFDPMRLNLLFRLDRQEWIVDGSGTVRSRGRSMRLSRDNFKLLRDLLHIDIPSLLPDKYEVAP